MRASDDNPIAGIIPVQSGARKLFFDLQSMKGAPPHVLAIFGQLSREVFSGINSPSGPKASKAREVWPEFLPESCSWRQHAWASTCRDAFSSDGEILLLHYTNTAEPTGVAIKFGRVGRKKKFF
jgi:hypothetical protein